MTPKPKTIKVTREDISKGMPLESDACPISLAIKRTMKVKRVDVSAYEITVGSTKMSIPRSAKRFMLDFDDGRPVKPFSFQLSLV